MLDLLGDRVYMRADELEIRNQIALHENARAG